MGVVCVVQFSRSKLPINKLKKAEMGTVGMVGGTPIVNFELTPDHKNFKWFTVEGYPHKNLKFVRRNYKNCRKIRQNFVKRKK